MEAHIVKRKTKKRKAKCHAGGSRETSYPPPLEWFGPGPKGVPLPMITLHKLQVAFGCLSMVKRCFHGRPLPFTACCPSISRFALSLHHGICFCFRVTARSTAAPYSLHLTKLQCCIKTLAELPHRNFMLRPSSTIARNHCQYTSNVASFLVILSLWAVYH